MVVFFYYSYYYPPTFLLFFYAHNTHPPLIPPQIFCAYFISYFRFAHASSGQGTSEGSATDTTDMMTTDMTSENDPTFAGTAALSSSGYRGEPTHPATGKQSVTSSPQRVRVRKPRGKDISLCFCAFVLSLAGFFFFFS